jgi:cytidine deaminase
VKVNDDDLIRHAVESTKITREIASTRSGWEFMGYVGAALVTEQGDVFTGVNLSLLCGIGFCAEHSAVADMVKHGQTKIDRIVATTAEGTIISPCGRCRELLYQIDAANSDCTVIIGASEQTKLRNLLPNNWQDMFDKPLS